MFSQTPSDGFAQTLDYFPIEQGASREKADRLYEYVTGMWPADAIWADMRTAFTRIADGNDADAQAAVDKLLTDFAQNQHLPVALYEISKLYSRFGRQDQAGKLRDHVINRWPTHKYTMWALMDVARLNVDLGNTELAEAAIDKLKADFSGSDDITGAVSCIAHEYLNCEKYAKGLALCQYILKTLPETPDTMWAQAGIAVANIGLGNMQAAEAATQKLITDFSGHERLAEAVYDVAYRHQNLGHYEKAKHLYQQVLQTWPQWDNLTSAKIGLVRSHIALGENATAEAVVNGLVAKLDKDFPSGSDLPTRAAEGYYYAGDCYQKLAKYTRSLQCYRRVSDDCPDYEYAWNALFLVGNNLEELKKSGVIPKAEADPVIKVTYEQLLEKHPRCPVAKIARRWLRANNSK
jgi:TolA-binding protein